MVNSLEPINVNLTIETPSLERGAFNNVCFITENDEAPRTIEVKTLSELIEGGYDRSSLAYNFCVAVFIQQGIESVFIRAKRTYESYEDALDSDKNTGYYFIVIETKVISEVLQFNRYLTSHYDFKLQFYSNNSSEHSLLHSGNLVSYYQGVFNSYDEENYYLNKAYRVTTYKDFESKPYPTQIENLDVYQPHLTPKEFNLREVLKDRYFDEDAFSTSVKPLDFTITSILKDFYAPDEFFTTDVRPLDFTSRLILKELTVGGDEAVTTIVRPMDFLLKDVLVQNQISGIDAYQPTVKPLDITLEEGA